MNDLNLRLLGFSNPSPSVAVEIVKDFELIVRGLSFDDICELSVLHLKTMNDLIKNFKEDDIVLKSDFFDDILLKCIIDEEPLKLEDLVPLKTRHKTKLLAEIYHLSFYDNAYLKSYKRKVNKANSEGKKVIGAVEAVEQKNAKEAKKNREEATELHPMIEDIIHIVNYLKSKNINNANEMSLKVLYNTYKVHKEIDNREDTRMVNILMAVLGVHHGNNEGYDTLKNKLNEI